LGGWYGFWDGKGFVTKKSRVIYRIPKFVTHCIKSN
jgi:hypothetical protein